MRVPTFLLLLAFSLAPLLGGCDEARDPAQPRPTRLTADAAGNASPSYEIVDLGTLGGNVSQATSLNDSDQVAGWSEIAESMRERPPSVVSPLMPRFTMRQSPASASICFWS